MEDDKQYSVDELCALSAQQLRAASGSSFVISLRDPENLTKEHLEKLRRTLQIDTQSTPIDLDLLNQKLLNSQSEAADLTYHRGCTTTPEPLSDLEYFQNRLPAEIDSYRSLLADGGRATHNPEEAGFSVYEKGVQQPEIIQYWTNKTRFEFRMLKEQHYYWRAYRKYQDRVRREHPDLEAFSKYARQLEDYLASKGHAMDTALFMDRKSQGALGDWRELQYREHKRADNKREEASTAVAEWSRAEETLNSAIREARSPAEIDRLQEQAGEYGFKKHIMQSAADGHARLLKWVDEQVLLVAREAGVMAGQRSLSQPSEDARPEKRKRRDVEGSDLQGPSTNAARAVRFEPSAKRQRLGAKDLHTPSEARGELQARIIPGPSESKTSPRRSSRLAVITEGTKREQTRRSTIAKHNPTRPRRPPRMQPREPSLQSVVTTRSGRKSVPPARYDPR